PVLGREQQIIGRVTIGERRAREDAGAVVVMLAAIGAEHVVICAMLVVMLEQIVRLRQPLDQLAPLELVERMTDPCGVPGMRGQHKEDVMKQDAGCQDSADDQPDYRDDLQLDSPVKFGSPARREQPHPSITVNCTALKLLEKDLRLRLKLVTVTAVSK